MKGEYFHVDLELYALLFDQRADPNNAVDQNRSNGELYGCDSCESHDDALVALIIGWAFVREVELERKSDAVERRQDNVAAHDDQIKCPVADDFILG